MQLYSINKRLNIPEYKITAILIETDREIPIKLGLYKRKLFICSGCGQVHKISQHALEESFILPIWRRLSYDENDLEYFFM